jgi:hypothetical protein
MRLSGWTRLGIALSGVWVVVVLGLVTYEYLFVTRPGFFVSFSASAFLTGGPVPVLLTWRILAVIFGPIIMGWLMALTARWIAKGFRA